MTAHGESVATRIRERIDAATEAARGRGILLVGEADAARRAIDASIADDDAVALARIAPPTRPDEPYRDVLDAAIARLGETGALERVARALLVRAAAASTLRPVQRQTAVAIPFAELRQGTIAADDLAANLDALWRCTRDRVVADDPEIDLGFVEVVTKLLVPSLRKIAMRSLRGLRLETTAATLLGLRGTDATPRGATEEDARRTLRQFCKVCRLAGMPLVIAIDGLGEPDAAPTLVAAIDNLVRYEPGLVVITTAAAAGAETIAFDDTLSLEPGAGPAPTVDAPPAARSPIVDALSEELRDAAERFHRENRDARTAHIRPPMSPAERDADALSASIDPVGCYFGLFEDAIARIGGDPADVDATMTAALDVIVALSQRGVRLAGAAIGAVDAAERGVVVELKRGDATARHELALSIDGAAADGSLALSPTEATELVAAARIRREQPRVGSRALSTAEIDRMMVQSQMLDDHPLLSELRRLACTVRPPKPVAAGIA